MLVGSLNTTYIIGHDPTIKYLHFKYFHASGKGLTTHDVYQECTSSFFWCITDLCFVVNVVQNCIHIDSAKYLVSKQLHNFHHNLRYWINLREVPSCKVVIFMQPNYSIYMPQIFFTQDRLGNFPWNRGVRYNLTFWICWRPDFNYAGYVEPQLWWIFIFFFILQPIWFS